MKKPLRILLVILLAIVLLFLGYFAYVMLSYSRLEDNLPLDVQGEADKTAAAGVPYNILSYNIGFGAYEPDYGFFMDGGKESWAFSEKRLIANMENIAEFINSQNADICILQEVIRTPPAPITLTKGNSSLRNLPVIVPSGRKTGIHPSCSIPSLSPTAAPLPAS